GSSQVENGTGRLPCLMCVKRSSSAAATTRPSETRQAAGSWKAALIPSVCMTILLRRCWLRAPARTILANPLILIGQRGGARRADCGRLVEQCFRLGRHVVEVDRFRIGEHAMEPAIGRSPTLGVVAGRKDDAGKAQRVGDERHGMVFANGVPYFCQI